MDFTLRHSGKDLRVISKELRRMNNKEVTKRFRQELRAAAAPLVPAVRASIAAIPTTGDRHTGLRKRMQKATQLRVKTVGRNAQVAILVNGRKMPDGERSLPAMMEGVKRFRHPVFGGAESERSALDQGLGHGRGWTWVTQKSHPYFYPVVRPLGITSRVAVNRICDGITKDIS